MLTSRYSIFNARLYHAWHLNTVQNTPEAPPHYFKCFHEQFFFKYLGYEYGDYPESEKASREVLSLPMHPFLEKEDQNIVVEFFNR